MIRASSIVVENSWREENADDTGTVRQNSLRDTYSGEYPAGSVVGTHTAEGVLRRGVDLEGVVGIDHGALRIEPLAVPGWGRAGVLYGPYRRENGLAFATFILNGHNTSQAENLQETLQRRLVRWIRGSEPSRPLIRVVRWLRSGRVPRALRQFYCWVRARRDGPPIGPLDENLAVGWFGDATARHPSTSSNTFVMHATGPENGELRASSGGALVPLIRGMQNVPFYYVIILRARGAAYYACSLANARQLCGYPLLRPLAIDYRETGSTVYAGVAQSVLGQLGFRLDTRVYGVAVDTLQTCQAWYGTAHFADTLRGTGPLAATSPAVGESWHVEHGTLQRTSNGVRLGPGHNVAVSRSVTPAGLIHVLADVASRTARAAVRWRATDDSNFWSVVADANGSRVYVTEDGRRQVVAESHDAKLRVGSTCNLQVTDDGMAIRAYVDGCALGEAIADSRLRNASGIGFEGASDDGDLVLHAFEAHPRTIPLPSTLDCGAPWVQFGSRVLVADDFSGPRQDLAGRLTRFGGAQWTRDFGAGVIEVTGDSRARVRASGTSPNPGRTLYTVPWSQPDFVDLSVTLTPPSAGADLQPHGLAGFVVWQDPDNYLTVNTWRRGTYGGASISSFYMVNGFENLYDAIWSNVGLRIDFGTPRRLRLCFDGARYLVFIDDEPVLFRELCDIYPRNPNLVIRRVGLVANWEWGNDTGTSFQNFCAMA